MRGGGPTAQPAESLINSQSILPVLCRTNQRVQSAAAAWRTLLQLHRLNGVCKPQDHVATSSGHSFTMPVQSRGRACQNCQSIKIKCELGAHGGEPPCERCTRLNKTCTLAAPKRQKDRVAELEAKVAALTKLLGSQGLQDASDEARSLSNSRSQSPVQSSFQTAASSQKKRKLETFPSSGEQRASAIFTSSQFDGDTNKSDGLTADWLDRLVSIELQQQLLDKYILLYQSTLPVVPLNQSTEAKVLRESMPYTLHTIVYIASAGTLSWDLQDKVNLALIEELTSATIVQCKKSLDLLQALQMVCLWYRSPRNSTQIPLFQLVGIASDMAVDLGLGGLQNPPALSIAGVSASLLDTIDAYRRWLTSYIIAETTSLLKRKSNEQSWTLHHDHCLQMLENNEHALVEDRRLAHYIHVTRLLASISEELDLNVSSVSPALGTSTCQKIMADLQDRITSWRLQVPFDMWSASLVFTGYFAEVLLYEIVLQTPTNKATFAAPFMVERLSTVDVPTPSVTQHHIDAVSSLLTACHNLLDTAASFTESEIVTLPTMIYAPRIAHTVVVLLKLHIAVTIQGNTYGQILQAEDLQTEAYLEKCFGLVARGSRIEPEAVMVRIMKYMQVLKEWLNRYEASMLEPGKLVASYSGFHAGSNAQEQGITEDSLLNTTSSQGLPSEPEASKSDQMFDSDAMFADFINTEFAMDDFGLFELYSETVSPEEDSNT